MDRGHSDLGKRFFAGTCSPGAGADTRPGLPRLEWPPRPAIRPGAVMGP